MSYKYPKWKSFVLHEDEDADWRLVDFFSDGLDFQNKRFPQMYKRVYLDGRVEYCDMNRFLKIVTAGPYEQTVWYSHLISDICNKIFPIRLPYMTPPRVYEVYCEDFLYNPKFGDFDTTGIFYIVTPSGEKVDVHRYFAQKERNKPFVEISERRYLGRKRQAEKRFLKKENNQ